MVRSEKDDDLAWDPGSLDLEEAATETIPGIAVYYVAHARRYPLKAEP